MKIRAGSEGQGKDPRHFREAWQDGKENRDRVGRAKYARLQNKRFKGSLNNFSDLYFPLISFLQIYFSGHGPAQEKPPES